MKCVLTRAALTLGAVALATTAVLLVAGAPPGAAYENLLLGAFGTWGRVARVLTVWVPLTLCGCGLLYTFRIGLWNIGVEGQVVFGALGATWVLRHAGASPALAVAAALGAAALMGAGWAAVAGLLKTHGGVNEIFAGLGLNFVAQGITLWLIFGPWKRPGVASMSGTIPFPPELWLANAPWGRVAPVSLVLAVGAVAVTGVLLGRSRIGLHLKAVGKNPRAARRFGLDPARQMVLAMGLGGALAGLAGGLQVAGVYHRLIPAVSSGYGYLGLLVAMLAGYRLAPVPVIALFFAALNVGSVRLPMVLQIDSSLSGVIQGALVLAALTVHGWMARRGGARG